MITSMKQGFFQSWRLALSRNEFHFRDGPLEKGGRGDNLPSAGGEGLQRSRSGRTGGWGTGKDRFKHKGTPDD